MIEMRASRIRDIYYLTFNRSPALFTQQFHQLDHIFNIVQHLIEINIKISLLEPHIVKEHLSQIARNPIAIVVLDEIPDLVQYIFVQYEWFVFRHTVYFDMNI